MTAQDLERARKIVTWWWANYIDHPQGNAGPLEEAIAAALTEAAKERDDYWQDNWKNFECPRCKVHEADMNAAVVEAEARGHKAGMDLAIDVVVCDTEAHESARAEGERAGREALNAADEALDQLWAAVGDRLLAKGPLSREYAASVTLKIEAARDKIRALRGKTAADKMKGGTG